MSPRAPFKAGDSYNTQLSPIEELAFRQWVATNKVPFNPDSASSDYDMRGFYRGVQQGSPMAQSGVNSHDNRIHYSDYYKTPSHQSFSSESQWADANTPQWANDTQLAAPSGRVLFDETPKLDVPFRSRGGSVMPLNKSASPAAFKSNLKAELAAGKPKSQSLAIAYRVQRDAKKRASGGRAVYDDSEGDKARKSRRDDTDTVRGNASLRQVGPSNAFTVPDKNTYMPDDQMRNYFYGRAPQGMAAGGTPFYVRSEAHGLEHAGMIHSSIAGRTDRIPMGVRSGSYVVPADVVSGLGQGNSMAGASALNRLFKIGPYGSAGGGAPKAVVPKMAAMPRPQKAFSDGGDVSAATQGTSPPIDIVAAGGEFSVPPEAVAQIGGGDVSHGHDILDAFVKHVRKKTIKTLRKLPGPKKN